MELLTHSCVGHVGVCIFHVGGACFWVGSRLSIVGVGHVCERERSSDVQVRVEARTVVPGERLLDDEHSVTRGDWNHLGSKMRSLPVRMISERGRMGAIFAS